jgi:hypothetical protein
VVGVTLVGAAPATVIGAAVVGVAALATVVGAAGVVGAALVGTCFLAPSHLGIVTADLSQRLLLRPFTITSALPASNSLSISLLCLSISQGHFHSAVALESTLSPVGCWEISTLEKRLKALRHTHSEEGHRRWQHRSLSLSMSLPLLPPT